MRIGESGCNDLWHWRCNCYILWTQFLHSSSLWTEKHKLSLNHKLHTKTCSSHVLCCRGTGTTKTCRDQEALLEVFNKQTGYMAMQPTQFHNESMNETSQHYLNSSFRYPVNLIQNKSDLPIPLVTYNCLQPSHRTIFATASTPRLHSPQRMHQLPFSAK
jgi:hypothetical protein